MYDVEAENAPEEFLHCYRAAGMHIQARAQGGISWIKATPRPPFLEHLSFRLGNQLFFVRIEDVDGTVAVPGSRGGLRHVAEGNRGHACFMPMRRRTGGWTPEVPGWGLLDARTGAAIDPVSLVSAEPIEMTDWELQDFAVQIVRDDLAKSGRELMSWHGHLGLDPAIWFVGDTGPEWVVVRAVRFPELQANPPKTWQEIANRCARLGAVGHFASVGVASADDAFDSTGGIPPTPLWRGHGMVVRFTGLVTPPSGGRTGGR